ncbi:MAG: YceI family protein [Saprospiraceae bacterium]|nr:YceI family protein [Saprospiraceae bacterium]
MKRSLLIIICIIISISYLSAQSRYLTRNGTVEFFGSTPLENVEAKNSQANCIIDFDKKEVAFSLLMKAFIFPKALMQEHFNENYVESDKYPKSIFKGKYKGDVNISKDGIYSLDVEGELTIHGVTKSIQVPGTIVVKGGKPTVKAKFQVTPQDYDIKIPALVRDKIAKIIDINVDATLEAYNK